MTHAQTIANLAAIHKGYAFSMWWARIYHERLVEAEAAATPDERLAAASIDTGYETPVGVDWGTS